MLIIVLCLATIAAVLCALPLPNGHRWGRPDAHRLVPIDPRWVDNRGNWTTRKLSQDAAVRIWGRVPSSLADKPVLLSVTWDKRQVAQDVGGAFESTWIPVVVHSRFDLSDAA